MKSAAQITAYKDGEWYSKMNHIITKAHFNHNTVKITIDILYRHPHKENVENKPQNNFNHSNNASHAATTHNTQTTSSTIPFLNKYH